MAEAVRYKVPYGVALSVPGFRVVSEAGHWPGHPGVMLFTVEDDRASRAYADRVVEVEIELGPAGELFIARRFVVG